MSRAFKITTFGGHFRFSTKRQALSLAGKVALTTFLVKVAKPDLYVQWIAPLPLAMK